MGFKGLYEVSDKGRVWSQPRPGTKGGLLKVNPSNNGRPAALLYREGRQSTRFIHHLVLEAFVGPRPEDTEALHHDDDKTNNVLANLRWGTRSENRQDAIRNGRDYYGSRTHCDQEHEFTEANTYWRTENGYRARRCKTCRLNNQRRRTQAKKDLAR